MISPRLVEVRDALAAPDALRMVTVCDACLTACCWQGKFYCSSARGAGTVDLPLGLLRLLDLEHADYWAKDSCDA